MKGLLRKELLALKSTFSILVIFVLVYAIIGVMGDNSSMVSGVLAVILMMLPANSISYDEFYHWDKYALTMPISRQKIVQSKYLLCFLLVWSVFGGWRSPFPDWWTETWGERCSPICWWLPVPADVGDCAALHV